MTAKDVLVSVMDQSHVVMNRYLSDFTDAELCQQPTPDSNSIALQLGHLISSEHQLLNMVVPGAAAPLPAGFAEQQDFKKGAKTDAKTCLTKQQYFDLWKEQRQATKAALASLPEADLDKPGPEKLQRMCATVGSVFMLIGTHPLLHAGQIAVVRRQLGKPILI